MSYEQFVDAAKSGTLKACMEPPRAAEYLSRRLLLPFFIMPFLGAGVGLALIGWIFTGLFVFLIGFVVQRLVKRNAASILFHQALQDERMYHDLIEAEVLKVQH